MMALFARTAEVARRQADVALGRKRVSFSDVITFIEPAPPRTPIPRSMAGWEARGGAGGVGKVEQTRTPRASADVTNNAAVAKMRETLSNEPSPRLKQRARTPRAPVGRVPVDDDEPGSSSQAIERWNQHLRSLDPELSERLCDELSSSSSSSSAAAAASAVSSVPDLVSPGVLSAADEEDLPTGREPEPSERPSSPAPPARSAGRHSHRSVKGRTPRAKTARTPRHPSGSKLAPATVDRGTLHGRSKVGAAIPVDVAPGLPQPAGSIPARAPSPSGGAHSPAAGSSLLPGTTHSLIEAQAWVYGGRSASARYGYELYGKSTTAHDLSSPELLC